MAEWMVKGHDGKKRAVPFYDARGIAAAGALRSHTEDLLKFLAANRPGGVATWQSFARCSGITKTAYEIPRHRPDLASGEKMTPRTLACTS